MLNLRAGSLRFRVLDLLADDALVAEDIAAHLFPPPKVDGPFASYDAIRARAETLRNHRMVHVRRVSRALDALQAAGLVTPCCPPRVAEWFEVQIERRGLVVALERAHPAFPGRVPDLAAYRRVVEQCRQGPGSTAALLGTAPSGARKRVYRELVDWCVIVSAISRTATDAGRALVRRVRGAA